MSREKLIEYTLDKISKLPDHKLMEVSDFAEFLFHKIEERNLVEGIQNLATDSKTFEFLVDEEELYSVSDLKEIYK